MRAGAKGEARVKPDHFGGGRRHFVPGGHDPETLGDRHRLELRLRQAHPVLLGHGFDLQYLAACKEVLQGQQTRELVRIGLAAKQRHHARARPALRWRRQAGFAKQGALGIGVGIGVFDRDARKLLAPPARRRSAFDARSSGQIRRNSYILLFC